MPIPYLRAVITIADLMSRQFNKDNNSTKIEDLNEFVHTVKSSVDKLEDIRITSDNDKCLYENIDRMSDLYCQH